MRWLGKHQYFDDLLIGGVLIQPPDPYSYAYTLTLPTTDGNAGEVLQTNGVGVLSWVPNGVATPYALTVGTGLDLTSGGSTWDGSAADTIELDITEITTTDGADRVLTSNADGTITAEPKLKFLPSAFDTTLQLGLDTSNAIMKIRRTSNTAGAGGILEILGGSATGTNLAGGDLRFVAGTGTGTSGVPGKFHFKSSNLHPSNPSGAQGMWDLALLQQLSRSESSFTLLGPESTIAAANYDYAKLAMSNTGAFTISSHDHSAMTGHITLDADGDVTLDADTGNICFKDDGVSLGCITSAGYSGTSATATALATARDFQTDLASTSAVSFDGTANNTHGVTGILPVANGGTGKNTLGSNSVLTGSGTSPVTDESTFKYSVSGPYGTTVIGDTVAIGCNLTSPNKSTGNRGTDFALTNGNSGAGTDIRAGRMFFSSGSGTGSRVGGYYTFYGHKAPNPTGGSTPGTLTEMTSFFTNLNSGVTDNVFFMKNLDNSRNFFRINHGVDGTVIMQNNDHANANGRITIDSAGPIDLDAFDGRVDLRKGGNTPASLLTGTTGELTIDSPVEVEINAPNIVLDSAGDIELNADGGDIDFLDGVVPMSKMQPGITTLYGNNGSNGANLVFKDEDSSHSITVKVPDVVTADKAISLPEENGTFALQSKGYKQIISIEQPYSYHFYLFNANNWHTSSTGTLGVFGSGAAPNTTLSTSYDHYSARIPCFVATEKVLLDSLLFSWYWFSSTYTPTTADHEFYFTKHTLRDGTTTAVTLTTVTATNIASATYNENVPYKKTFTFNGTTANRTLDVGDALTFYMRQTSGSGNIRTQIYGRANLSVTLTD
jgi:hypothetical protein